MAFDGTKFKMIDTGQGHSDISTVKFGIYYKSEKSFFQLD